MDASGRPNWLRAGILFGIVYLLIGIAFAALANTAASDQMRVAWRLAAYLASAAAFAAHIGYDHFRLHNSPPRTALHASAAVALGAFALAVVAIVHAQWAASGNQLSRVFALVAWPVVTAVPAFFVAFAVAAVLARRRRSG